jgi:hypothetical protein
MRVSLELRQLASTLKKNAIEKRRNIRVTCCECFSHLVLLVLLLLGFGLSKIIFISPQNYVKLDIYIPPDFVRLTAADTMPIISRRLQSTSKKLGIRLGIFLSDLQKQLQGPLPIPSFDQFIYSGRFLTSVAKETSLKRIVERTTFGKRFSNLLEIGDLHFAPYPSKEVDSLMAHLNRTTTTFKSMVSFTHASEDDGIRYILNHLDRRALALIVIRQIEPMKINYLIRQNYTTLPNTNEILYKNIRGLDTDYQMYLVSGFLTLEQTIDAWALKYGVRQVDPSATCAAPEVLTAPFPSYEFDSNPFFSQVGFLLGLAMTMSTLYPVSRLVKCVVEEKESVCS